MDDDSAARPVPAGRRVAAAGRPGRPRFRQRLEQPAPADDLVLVVAPGRSGQPSGRCGWRWVIIRAGPVREQVGDALRAAAVQVDRQVRRRARPVAGAQAGEREQPVDPRVQPISGRSAAGAARVMPAGGAAAAREGGDRGEQVTQPQRPQHEESRSGSAQLRARSSRSSSTPPAHGSRSPPAGPGRRPPTAATSAGALSLASAGGLYCSVRPSKKRRVHATGDEQRDADLAGGLGGQRAREADHPELGRAVGGGVADGLDAQGGRAGDHATASCAADAVARRGRRRPCRSG